MPRSPTALLCAALALAACPKRPPPGADGGAGPPNICNSAADAQGKAECQLTLGQRSTFYIDHVGKQLWLGVTLPAGLTARSLLHLSAGYSAEIGTPVQLAINVLQPNQQTSLGRAVDDHDPGPPKPIDLILPLLAAGAQSGSQLLLLANDDGNQHADDRSPFFITVSVMDDPDPNLPGSPTAVPLTQGANGVYAGSATGVLSTPNRIDEFQISVPQGMKRPILYLSLTASNAQLAPPVAYLLGYTLTDSQGSVVATDHVPNRYLAIDLATARLVGQGSYQIQVEGWHAESDPTPVPGDLRLTYTLQLQVMPDLDPNEPNDSPGSATPISVALDQAPQPLTGRLAFVPDPDWFSVDLSAESAPTRLHYKLTPGAGPGRFPPLPPLPARQLLAFTQVNNGGGSADVQACETDPSFCPNTLAEAPAIVSGIASEYCESDGGAFCLHSYRQEASNFQALSNFEGLLAIPPHASTVRYYLVYQDQGEAWADDVPYTLSVEWTSESPDKRGGYHDSEATALPATLTVDVQGSSFPVPPSGATTLTGSISVGDAFFVNLDPNATPPTGVHGPVDYDAVPSSLDLYRIDFPAFDPDAGPPPLGATWELQWDIEDKGPGGSRPYDIGLSLELCDGSDGGAANCTPVPPPPSTGDPFSQLNLLGYSPGTETSWYTGQSHVPVWQLQDNGSTATITVEPDGCFCFEKRFLQGGQFYLKVVGVDRTSYADARYQIRLALTGYPQSYATDGGPVSCPVDAGFTDGNGNPVTGCAMEPGP